MIMTDKKVNQDMPDIPAATVEISAKAGAGLDKSKMLIPNFFDKS